MQRGVMWYVLYKMARVQCEMWPRDAQLMWPIWCHLKYGITKWNQRIARGAGQCHRYEMCDMVRNDGLTWNVARVVWTAECPSEMVFDVE